MLFQDRTWFLLTVTCLFWRNYHHSELLNCSFSSRGRKTLVPFRQVHGLWVHNLQALHQRPADTVSHTLGFLLYNQHIHLKGIGHLASSRSAFCRYCSSGLVGSQLCSSKYEAISRKRQCPLTSGRRQSVNAKPTAEKLFILFSICPGIDKWWSIRGIYLKITEPHVCYLYCFFLKEVKNDGRKLSCLQL